MQELKTEDQTYTSTLLLFILFLFNIEIICPRLYCLIEPLLIPHFHLKLFTAIEQLLVTLHLFPSLPDVDFILHFGDGCTDGVPVLSWNICR